MNEYRDGLTGGRVFEPSMFLRSIGAVALILRSLAEILMMNPEEVERLRQQLKAECIRQKREYEYLARHR